MGGGSPAGGGSRGSDISGSREGGSSTGGFFRGFGGSRLGAGGLFPGMAWSTSWRGRVACQLEPSSLSIYCSGETAAAQTADKDAMQFTQAFLGFAHLEVIDNLLNTVDTTR